MGSLASIGPVVSEEKMFENVDNIHTYIRTTEAYLNYKLTYEPKGSGELKLWTTDDGDGRRRQTMTDDGGLPIL